MSYDADGNINTARRRDLRLSAGYAPDVGVRKHELHLRRERQRHEHQRRRRRGRSHPRHSTCRRRSCKGPTTLAYVYGAGHNRIKEIATTAAGVTTTYYFGSYEELTRAG